MKRKTFTILAMAVALIIGGVSCSNKDSKKPAASKAAAKTVVGNLPNYRYVDLDTILSHYNLAKDFNDQLLSMQNNYDNTGRQKSNQLQNEATRLQKKYQNNYTATEAEMNADQQKLANMQAAAERDMGALQNKISEFASNAQKVVNDSIESFIADYNKTHGYDAILFKAATLYINPDLDITEEVIEGLNARYNKQEKK